MVTVAEDDEDGDVASADEPELEFAWSCLGRKWPPGPPGKDAEPWEAAAVWILTTSVMVCVVRALGWLD